MRLLFALIPMYLFVSLAYSAEMSNEQIDFCTHLKKAWNKECSSYYKKDKLKTPKMITFTVGCEGPGFATFYNRKNVRCGDNADIISESYNEIWKNVDKGITERVYWNNGNYVYTSFIEPRRFNGGNMTVNGKALNVKEYMGVNRKSHLQEMADSAKK